MMNQTFALTDIPQVVALAGLELILSADNAIVLGLIVYHLPAPLRQKALYIGVVSAFLFRGLALAVAAYILQYSWIQLIGATYLIYLSASHFMKKRGLHAKPKAASFWKTVLLIEFFDLAFAIDSIVAGVAFISSPHLGFFHPKLWIAYVGGMIGLLGIRSAASFFSNLIHRFPRLETSAYLMVGWIGLKLALSSAGDPFPGFHLLFWIALALLFLFGFTQKK